MAFCVLTWNKNLTGIWERFAVTNQPQVLNGRGILDLCEMMCGKAQHFLGTHCVPGSPVEMLSAWAARSLAVICIMVYTLALTGSMTHVQGKARAVGQADEGCIGALSKQLALASLICSRLRSDRDHALPLLLL